MENNGLSTMNRSSQGPEGTKESSLTAEEKIHSQMERLLIEPDIDATEKLNIVPMMEPPEIPHARVVKGCVGSFSDVLDWNVHFRKSYTVLMWIRPVMKADEDEEEDDENSTGSSQEPSLLYRIAIKTRGDGIDATKNNTEGKYGRRQSKRQSQSSSSNIAGVEVCFSPWKKLDDSRTVQTSLTAVTKLFQPRKRKNADNADEIYISESIPCPPITLGLDSWSLIGMTHVFPYLKKSSWTLTVNGQDVLTGELMYPELAPAIFSSGQNSSTNPNVPTLDWDFFKINNTRTTLDWYGISLYSQPIPSPIQALVAATGISCLRQYPTICGDGQAPRKLPNTFANLLPRIPAVPNWSKGTTMDGSPKVGVPLIVHHLANELQQLSDATFVIGATANVAVSNVNQIMFPCTTEVPGTTASVPKVGLLQPTPVDLVNAIPTTRLSKSITFNLSHPEIGLQRTSSNRISPLTLLEFSLSALVLPFFLAQGPPRGHHLLNDTDKYRQESWKHLYALFSKDAKLAIRLVDMHTHWIQRGGVQVHEQVLQEGLLPILSVTMRKALVRAQQSLPNYISLDNNKYAKQPYVPPPLAEAVSRLIQVCCGEWEGNKSFDNLSPATQIRRSCDLAMTALFGLGLDLDLWGGHSESAEIILRPIASMYGNSILTGTLLRSQISVQFLLDQIRLASWDPQDQKLESVAEHLTKLLESMLLSSLSNERSVSQGENDISACMGALSDCHLGSVEAHVILSALVRILCCSGVLSDCKSSSVMVDALCDEVKQQITMQLRRNLLMGQFHDVVAPMLLSRTVFSGDRSLLQQRPADIEITRTLSWQHHWQRTLIIFTWIASVAGSEGRIAAKSSGSLFLASGLAGSLQGALQNTEEKMIYNLFLPPQRSSLEKGIEVSYVDTLSDRLAVLLPLLPGLLVSLLSHSSESTFDTTLPSPTAQNLVELTTGLRGAFHRVFGRVNTVHRPSNNRPASKVNNDGEEKLHFALEMANSYVPHLLVASILIEKYIQLHKPQEIDSVTTILVANKDISEKTTKDAAPNDSSVKVSPLPKDSGETESEFSEIEDTSELGIIIKELQTCQKGFISILSEIITTVIILGGGDASTKLWRKILSKLKESVVYAVSFPSEDIGDLESWVNKPSESDKSREQSKKQKNVEELAQNILCRLAARVLVKCLKRESFCEVWNAKIASGVSKLCALLEEKQLMGRALGPVFTNGNRCYSCDQVLLFCALLDILSYGRDISGWCQLILPNMPAPKETNTGDSLYPKRVEEDRFRFSFSRKSRTSTAPDAASKLMLPILQPCLRILSSCLGNVSSQTRINVPLTNQNQVSIEDMKMKRTSVRSITGNVKRFKKNISMGNATVIIHMKQLSLLEHVIDELEPTLTAAIVGLSFPNARDVALNSLSSLRRAVQNSRNTTDNLALKLYSELLSIIVEEITARYEGERRRRETALFDAYDEESSDATREAAEASRVVEKMILGNDLAASLHTDVDGADQLAIDTVDSEASRDSKSISDDFVMFHENYQNGDKEKIVEQLSETGGKTKMGWSQYDGLGEKLGHCSSIIWKSSQNDDTPLSGRGLVDVLSSLAVYLDAWDTSAAFDATETIIVELFNADINFDSEGITDDLGGTVIASLDPQQLPLIGSETAADAMSTFIEIANVEKARLGEISASFLPNHRYSLLAYAERFCWARYMEIAKADTELSLNMFWERGVNDGNRDVRSRIATVPCNPQFRRYIPKYLDHSANMGPSCTNPINSTSETSSLEANEIDSTTQNTNVETSLDISQRRQLSGKEMDEFTKTLLETANLEIVDITKKEIPDEDVDPNVIEQDAALGSDDLHLASSQDDEGIKSKNGDVSDVVDFQGIPAEGEHMSEYPPFKSALGDSANDKASHYNINASPYASPPDNSSSSLSLIHPAAAGMIEQYVDNCLHVKTEGSRKCTMLLTGTHLILEYDMESEGLFEGELLAVQEEADRHKMCEDVGDSGKKLEEELAIHEQIERKHREAAALRPKSVRWNLSEVSHIYLRRYRLRDTSIELFFIPSGGSSFGGYGLYSSSTSLFLDFGPGYEGNTKRDNSAFAMMKRTPPQALKQWPDRSIQFLHEQLSRITISWAEGRVTNFDYLLHLNMLAGRSYNDICQYPVMPWVLSDYTSEDIPDLSDRKNYRDLSKPMGALNPKRLQDFVERFSTFADPSIPPFMYGSHYSTSAGVVLHFLVRSHPFAELHRQLQGGHFDVADRLFSSVPRTWDMCTGSSAAEVKELTPEWYCNPSFLKNSNKFKLGTSQDGIVLEDVILPPWANGSSEKFIEVMRSALESDVCSEMLPDWIDLIFGRKQQGPESIKANNVFFYLTYYGSVDVAAIENESLRQATELQIMHFGQCPMQLFSRPHVRRLSQEERFRNLSIYQILSLYTHTPSVNNSIHNSIEMKNEIPFLAFNGAPISHWVHLDSPPPGPHAALIAVRLAGTDRCLAVDNQGIFHCFRWAWKGEEEVPSDASSPFGDRGCFVAQRELPRFRSVPRLIYTHHGSSPPPVAISKTLFAGGSVLLVLSDGDGCGSLGMQLVDPSKGSIRGEALVHFVHSDRISCIAADPIGTAAGHGGVGGELAIVGSVDGTATLWRFMSSHYLPLRPRVRLKGHRGSKVCAVAISSAIQVVATISRNRCCLFSITNGTLLRCIPPPTELDDASLNVTTTFADCPSLAISVQGFIVTVCETAILSQSTPQKNIISLHLFTLEGVSLGFKILEPWRGTPHKVSCTPDGTAVMVCSGRGVSVHRISAISPLEFLDEWQITEADDMTEDIPKAWDVDFGPNLNRPVLAAAGCSSGVLRLHALPGISVWSGRHKKPGISNPFAMPARRIKSVVQGGFGIGSKVVGMGKDITKEVSSDVRERGVGSFLGSVFRKSDN